MTCEAESFLSGCFLQSSVLARALITPADLLLDELSRRSIEHLPPHRHPCREPVNRLQATHGGPHGGGSVRSGPWLRLHPAHAPLPGKQPTHAP